MKTILLSFIIACSISLNAKSQKKQGYIINLQNDTLTCALETQLFGAPKYELPGQTVLKKINADSIKEYRFHDGKYPFISVKLPTDSKRTFIACLERGAISIFEEQYNTSSTNPFTNTSSSNNIIKWYAGSNTDDVSLIKTNQVFMLGTRKKERQNAFYNLLAKDPELLERFKKTGDYSFKAIRNIVAEYNTRALAAK